MVTVCILYSNITIGYTHCILNNTINGITISILLLKNTMLLLYDIRAYNINSSIFTRTFCNYFLNIMIHFVWAVWSTSKA